MPFKKNHRDSPSGGRRMKKQKQKQIIRILYLTSNLWKMWQSQKLPIGKMRNAVVDNIVWVKGYVAPKIGPKIYSTTQLYNQQILATYYNTSFTA